MLDWDTLRVILSVAREGTIMGAARELDVNVATVSRQISRAEKALGAKLFNRRHKGLTPTQDGLIAIKAAQAVEEQVVKLHQRVEGSNQVEAGQIRLSVPLNVMQYGLASDIRQFQNKHPDITFDINATDQEVDFTALQADVVVRVGENPPNSLWGFKIATVGVSFYASRDFMDKWGPHIETDPATAPIPYITLSPANPLADRDEFKTRFPKAHHYGACNGMDSVIPLVREGVAAGRMMRYMGRTYPDLVKLFDCDETWSRTVWVLTHQDYQNTKRIRIFMEFIRDQFQSRMNDF